VGYANGEAPVERQNWVAAMNALIRPLAQQDHVVLVDLEKAFLAQPDYAGLFLDHVHPSAAGTAVIVKTFFDAITGPAVASGARRSPLVFGFSR